MIPIPFYRFLTVGVLDAFFLPIPFHFNNIILESWKKYFCSACSLTLVEMLII